MYTFHLPPYLPNRIDLPCPKGWWGNPVCGPCHCAVSKGFDPDCNKTNGQCQCKVRPGLRVDSWDTQPSPPRAPSPGRWLSTRAHAHEHAHLHMHKYT